MHDGNRGSPVRCPLPMGATGTNLHSAWLQFIRYCTELGHGEIEKLKIQDGVPMIAEMAVKKVKFSP